MVADINPGAGGSEPREVTAVGGEVFFLTRTDPTAGQELWKTDGTSAGTVRVAGPPRTPPGMSALTAANGMVFFTGAGLGGTASFTRQLWRSDGTADGTVPILDAWVRHLGDVQSSFVFVDDGLWASDGSVAGTGQVAATPTVHHTIFAEGLLIFLTGYPYETAMWKSDGTPGGTAPIVAFDRIYSSPYETTLAYAAGTIFIAAYTDDFGHELWAFQPCTDGTLACLGGLIGTTTSNTTSSTSTTTTLPCAQLDGGCGNPDPCSGATRLEAVRCFLDRAGIGCSGHELPSRISRRLARARRMLDAVSSLDARRPERDMRRLLKHVVAASRQLARAKDLGADCPQQIGRLLRDARDAGEGWLVRH
jgi:hypothetical protein